MVFPISNVWLTFIIFIWLQRFAKAFSGMKIISLSMVNSLKISVLVVSCAFLNLFWKNNRMNF
jgi:hypothetical protein